MHIDVLDIYDLPPTQSAPALFYPVPGNISVDQDVQVGNSAFVKLQNRNVFDGSTVSSAEIPTKLISGIACGSSISVPCFSSATRVRPSPSLCSGV